MIGFGFDVHRLAEGETLVLGGIDFPGAHRGTVAHSDGDVLLHAIMDALLGACALGDIGLHFPDTDPRYRGVSSLHLLKEIRTLVEQDGKRIVNIDSTVVLEAPKLRSSIDQMRATIAKALGLDLNMVSIKATTNEGLGFLGREEGIAAYAICQVENR